MTIKLPFRKLAVAALFASTDETRFVLNSVRIEPKPYGVLLIATNGRQATFIRHECIVDPNFIKPILIPSTLINRLGIRTVDEIFEDEDAGPERQPTEPPSLDCEVTVTGKDLSIRFEKSHGVIGETIDLAFPTMLQVIPATPPEAYKVSSFSGSYMLAYEKAARWLAPFVGAILCAGHSRSDEFDHAGIYSIRIKGCPDFYSVLMPVKTEKSLEAVDIPDWLKA